MRYPVESEIIALEMHKEIIAIKFRRIKKQQATITERLLEES